MKKNLSKQTYKKQKIIRWELELGLDIGPELLGPNDAHIRYLEQYFLSSITVRGTNLVVHGPENEKSLIEAVFRDLMTIYREKKIPIHSRDVETAVALAANPMSARNNGNHKIISQESSLSVSTISPLLRIPVQAKSEGQKNYLEKLKKYSILFVTGPAGSGKTYLAVAVAVASLLEGSVDRIILVRPVVEAGEHLGFLPGDIKEKVDPYFRPIYDALMELLPSDKLKKFLYSGMIEIAPLAYMRGRTLNRSFIILDEAQNTTSGQMKMFLTRIGRDSRAVITGDITQVDLPDHVTSGLTEALAILKDVDGVGQIELSGKDIVRHGLVIEIVAAYDRMSKSKKK
ncbi:MAG: PhoH family protein [bacterium]|nr:PhoH family protein [bacterium]